jgi:hypothetical protein
MNLKTEIPILDMIFNRPAFTDLMYLSTHSSKLNFSKSFFHVFDINCQKQGMGLL